MKKKLMLFTMLITMFMVTPTVVRADLGGFYLSQVITSSVYVGQNISFEISDQPETDSIAADADDGVAYYLPEVWKTIISYSVDGTVNYDSSVLEYVDVSVSQKGGCCYDSPVPEVKAQDGKIGIVWDSIDGSDWGYHDTILVNFKVISVPSNNKTTIEFVPSTAGIDGTKVTLNVNANLLSSSEIKDNETENNGNLVNYIIIGLLSGILVFLVTLICVMLKNNKKQKKQTY